MKAVSSAVCGWYDEMKADKALGFVITGSILGNQARSSTANCSGCMFANSYFWSQCCQKLHPVLYLGEDGADETCTNLLNGKLGTPTVTLAKSPKP